MNGFVSFNLITYLPFSCWLCIWFIDVCDLLAVSSWFSPTTVIAVSSAKVASVLCSRWGISLVFTIITSIRKFVTADLKAWIGESDLRQLADCTVSITNSIPYGNTSRIYVLQVFIFKLIGRSRFLRIEWKFSTSAQSVRIYLFVSDVWFCLYIPGRSYSFTFSISFPSIWSNSFFGHQLVLLRFIFTSMFRMLLVGKSKMSQMSRAYFLRVRELFSEVILSSAGS